MVEPLYQINLGYAARAMKNFGITKMNIVAPRCRHTGKDAIKYSKHAAQILKSARLYKSIDAATSDCDIVIGTTGIWHKSNGAFFNVYDIERAKSFVRKGKRVALLIGRDDTGLTKAELKGCDLTIFIPTDKEYTVLNVSHALAIILYELTKEKENQGPSWQYADKRSVEGIVALFGSMIENNKNIRDKSAVISAFTHVIKRSSPTRKELNALSIALAPERDIKTKRNRK